MSLRIYFLILVCLPTIIHAQKIEAIDVKLNGGVVVLAFDMLPKESSKELYDIKIFSSRDNYQKSLRVQSGQTESASSGTRLTFTINASEEYAGFKGEIDFKITASMSYNPLMITQPASTSNFKKGTLILVAWTGGEQTDLYKLDLYKGTSRISTLDAKISNNKYEWKMPEDTKPGKYNFKIESASNASNTAMSADFMIKRKIPLVVKILPVVAIGAGVYFLTSGSSDSGGDAGTTDNLPLPPDPPTIGN